MFILFCVVFGSNLIETYKNQEEILKFMVLEQAAIEEFGKQFSNVTSGTLQNGLQPVLSTVQPFIADLIYIIGGIAGIYLIMIIARVYYERKKVKLLTKILYDLDHQNMHHGIKCSRDKKTLIQKIIALFRKPKDNSFKKK